MVARKLSYFIFAVLLLLPVAALSLHPSHYYISLSLNTTWNELCPKLDIFRIHLSDVTRTPKTLIIFANENEHCDATKITKDIVQLFVYVSKRNVTATVIDVKETLRLENALHIGDQIGRYKITTLSGENTEGVKRKVYTNGTIAVVIGIVLAIYLIGHLLILSMKSYSSRSEENLKAERPVSWIIAADNINFTTTEQDGRPSLTPSTKSLNTRKTKLAMLANKSKKVIPHRSTTGKLKFSTSSSQLSMTSQDSYSKLPDL